VEKYNFGGFLHLAFTIIKYEMKTLNKNYRYHWGNELLQGRIPSIVWKGRIISKHTQAYMYRPEGKRDLTYPETTDVFALISNEIMPLQRR
jgi:hypothetical protein